MTNKQFQEILGEIFDPLLLKGDVPIKKISAAPTFEQIKEYAKLIIKNSGEEKFQKLFANNENILLRGTIESDETILGVIAKPPIGIQNFADFVIISVGQGGAKITLIELENPSDRLFTKKLTPANKLQSAIGQVTDWDIWIEKNSDTFKNDLLDYLKKQPKYPNKSNNGSFIVCSKSQLVKTWNAFGGNEGCHISFLIIIGRFGRLTEEEKQRLYHLNKKNNQRIKFRTFDNYIRKAIDGPKYFW